MKRDSLACADEHILDADRTGADAGFDAGANADGVSSIVATLDQQRVRATFFLTGDFVRSFPESARRIVASGHRLGHHSVNHPQFTQLSDQQIGAQL